MTSAQDTIIVGARDWFDQILGPDNTGANKIYPFRVRILLARPEMTPRHPAFEYLREFNVDFLELIVLHKPLNIQPGRVLQFWFPERYLSVHEQKHLLPRLQSHPDVANVGRIDMVTQNALIVGSVDSTCIWNFSIPGSKEYGYTEPHYHIPE